MITIYNHPYKTVSMATKSNPIKTPKFHPPIFHHANNQPSHTINLNVKNK
jgi:hypothetical protein